MTERPDVGAGPPPRNHAARPRARARDRSRSRPSAWVACREPSVRPKSISRTRRGRARCAAAVSVHTPQRARRPAPGSRAPRSGTVFRRWRMVSREVPRSDRGSAHSACHRDRCPRLDTGSSRGSIATAPSRRGKISPRQREIRGRGDRPPHRAEPPAPHVVRSSRVGDHRARDANPTARTITSPVSTPIQVDAELRSLSSCRAPSADDGR